MGRVRVYVDGFNLYHAVNALERPELKWLNYRTLSESLLRPGEQLDEVNFFTAVLNWNAEKRKRHINYIKALHAVGVKVHKGDFKRSRKYCKEKDRYCYFYEEKQTDVAIAVALTADAVAKRMTRAVLITADSDQIPTVKFLRSLPDFTLTLAYPPGRAQEARDLGNAVGERLELTPGRLGTCRLPRTVHDDRGKAVAFMPALYATDAA